jgi:bifunctional non-homologous end joining protein LigD
MAMRAGERVRLITRNGFDWSRRYPAVAETVVKLKIAFCLIDGEIAACDGIEDSSRDGPGQKT